MADATQLALRVSVPTLAVLSGMLVNNSRLSDVNRRIDDFRAHVDTRFVAVDAKFVAMEKIFMERLRRVEEVLDARLGRIGQELHPR